MEQVNGFLGVVQIWLCCAQGSGQAGRCAVRSEPRENYKAAGREEERGVGGAFASRPHETNTASGHCVSDSKGLGFLLLPREETGVAKLKVSRNVSFGTVQS